MLLPRVPWIAALRKADKLMVVKPDFFDSRLCRLVVIRSLRRIPPRSLKRKTLLAGPVKRRHEQVLFGGERPSALMLCARKNYGVLC